MGLNPENEDNIVGNIRETVSMLINQNSVPYEFRTTVIKEYHDLNVFKQIADMLEGARIYCLQNYVCSEFVPDKTLHGYNKEELQPFVDVLSHKIKEVKIRGLD